ncbi:hypothetical protein TNCV_98151 [Trichonephila clavipes]|nr:hypothetical protein TNCV_98151 [Trichonephila clavipes]
MEKHLQGHYFASSDVVKGDGGLTEVAKNSFQLCYSHTSAGRCVSSTKGTTLKMDVLQYSELFRVRFSIPCPKLLIHATYAFHQYIRVTQMKTGQEQLCRNNYSSSSATKHEYKGRKEVYIDVQR